MIDSYGEKIDLLVKARQPDFLYELLKYYGESSLIDEKNASFLLHAGKFDMSSARMITTDELVERFKSAAAKWGMSCKVETSTKQ